MGEYCKEKAEGKEGRKERGRKRNKFTGEEPKV